MADGPASGAAPTIETLSGWSLVQISAWRDGLDGIGTVAGSAVPAGVGTTVRLGDQIVIRMSPGRLWILGESGADQDFVLRLDPDMAGALDLTAGRRRFRLQGARLGEVLSKLAAVDPEGAQLAPGRAVQTAVHHVPVLMLRMAEDRVDILAPLSFAQSLQEWIEDACLE